MDDMAFTIAVAVNNREILNRNLLVSPELRPGHPHQILIQEGYPSASLAHNAAIDAAENDIIVFVHQDIYFPGPWFSELAQTVRQLDATNPSWGVLGSFGSRKAARGGIGSVYTNGMGLHGNKITEPTPIETLDEIVLVIRKSSGLRFDSVLPSFHLYGADICLQARDKGFKNYAVPGFCVHNTNQLLRLPEEFNDCYWHIKNKWSKYLPIYTACITMSRFDTQLRQRTWREFVQTMLGSKGVPVLRVEDPRQLMPYFEVASTVENPASRTTDMSRGSEPTEVPAHASRV